MTPDEVDRLIGRREDHRTEFKAVEALEKPASIAREVVALLNAQGGDIWIGVDEQNGVAVSIRGSRDAERARQSLWNHFVDTIEPSPRHEEVATEVSPGDQGAIHIAVQEGPRKPYSLLAHRGRQFPIRIGDRIRDMSLEEIGEAFRLSKPLSDSLAERMIELGQELEVPRSSALWWAFFPVEPLTIDFEHMDPATKTFFRRVLMDPSETGNRPTGWTMVFDETEPTFGTGGVVHRFGREPAHEVQIRSNGRMTFQAPRRRLSRNWDGADPDVFPFALIELPISTFRMAARVFERYGDPNRDLKVLVAAQLNDVAGARLAGGSPQSPFFRSNHTDQGTHEGKTLIVPPFEVGSHDIVKTPDLAGYRLVRRLYEKFGLEEAAIPPELDRNAGVLRFPA